MSTKKRHVKTVKRIIVDITYLDHCIYPVEDHQNWNDFYPDAEEEIPNDLPTAKGLELTAYANADHA
jgi:hypothetical protein